MAQVPQARLLPDGRAVAPPSAPASVRAMIEAAGLLDYPLDSTRFMRWGGGGGGGGSWVRIYANREHVFGVIAGLRWDTSFSEDGDRSGPGWSEALRQTRGFRVRHPLGLLAAEPLS